MQLIAPKLELVSSNKVRPPFASVIQRIPDYAKIVVEVFRIREQYARLFKELADCGTVQVQPVSFDTQTQVGLPGTQADAEFMNRGVAFVDDTARKGESSTKRRFGVPANHEQLRL
jgi:hypothetical protein